MPQKILVVDNDQHFLEQIRGMLQQDGHAVRCTDSVFMCLDLLTSITPDIIFIDFIMPYLGGDDLCRAIRNYAHLQDVYVVIVSAVALEHPLNVYSFGADACIA